MNARHGHADVLTVTYGDCTVVLPLLASLQLQASHVQRVLIWHNGPEAFDRTLLPAGTLEIEVHESGENLGYGAGINRLWALSSAGVAVVVNPDVELDASCLTELLQAAWSAPPPVLVGGILGNVHGNINAFALSLTWDGLGINIDRGKNLRTFAGRAAGQAAESRAVAPSGALFAVNRDTWAQLGGGPLFTESLFLYLEDVALGLRVRRLGGRLRFCAQARGLHRFSNSTGRRSALKLFHVERNRLWLQRTIASSARTLATMPFTWLRFAAYLKSQQSSIVNAESVNLLPILLRAWKVGMFAPVPQELRTYLAGGTSLPLLPFVAPLRNQLQDPTA